MSAGNRPTAPDRSTATRSRTVRQWCRHTHQPASPIPSTRPPAAERTLSNDGAVAIGRDDVLRLLRAAGREPHDDCAVILGGVLAAEANRIGVSASSSASRCTRVCGGPPSSARRTGEPTGRVDSVEESAVRRTGLETIEAPTQPLYRDTQAAERSDAIRPHRHGAPEGAARSPLEDHRRCRRAPSPAPSQDQRCHRRRSQSDRSASRRAGAMLHTDESTLRSEHLLSGLPVLDDFGEANSARARTLPAPSPGWRC